VSLSPSFSIFQVFINLFVSFVNRFITVFSLSNPLINPFCTDWVFSSFVSYYTYDFKAPLIFRNPFCNLYLHIITKHNYFLLKTSFFRFKLCISSQIFTSGLSPLNKVSAQFLLFDEGCTPSLPTIIFTLFLP